MTVAIDWVKKVEDRKDALLADLQGLLRIESVKDLDSSTTDRPMGDKIGQALEYVLNLADNDGFITKNIDGYAGVVEFGESQEYIGVLAHVDVVPAEGEWVSPPFEPSIRDGKLFARGAIDDKGPAMAAYYALKIMKELELPIKNKIRLILGTDEESGMRCVRHYFEKEPQPILGFSPDADFPIVHAEKGQINVKLALPSAATNEGELVLAEFTAGERVNMVPGVAIAKIEGEHLEKLISQFNDYLGANNLKGAAEMTGSSKATLTLYGKTVHGMEPQNGVNAALELIHFLNTIEFTGADQSFISFADTNLYRDPFGEKLGVAHREDVLGPLTVNAGVFRYHHQHGGSVNLNMRAPLHTNVPQTIETVEEHAGQFGWTIEESRHSNPHYVAPEHPMIQTLQEAYQSITGDEPTLLTTGGGTYARLMKNGVAYGATFPGKEMTAHQANEYIEIDDLLKATAIYAKALYDLSIL
jgi:succinyl-diaminopimelate desuccinylase